MDALYFRVSSERQTTENQFEDLPQVAEKDGSGRDWSHIREALSRCMIEEHRAVTNATTRTLYRVDAQVAASLARECVYVEQGRSSKIGARQRPLFEQMKRDAAAGKFDRLLVKVSRLGRDMKQVIDSVYELSSLGITVIPVKAAVTEPITSSMGRLLWSIAAWFAEMENEERAEAIKAGQARARAKGTHMGRPRAVFDRDLVIRLRDQEHLSWPEIARRIGAGVGTVVRAYRNRNYTPEALRKSDEVRV
jgi:DNA invertase Pin-like site-specific DNA recombinase